MKLRFAPVLAVSVLALATAPTAADPKEDAVRAEMTRFQGAWKLRYASFGGQTLPKEQAEKFRLVIEGNRMIMKGGPKDVVSTFAIDPRQNPPAIDIIPPVADAKNLLGIYAFDGEILRVCGSEDGRPMKFAAPPKSNITLFVFERTKQSPAE